MVRVVSCHHFVSQDVFLSENDPVAFCGAQNKLLISRKSHIVNVHDLDTRGAILHTFPTIDIVKQIIYCESGNYVATIESKVSWAQTVVSYVRVYFNWWVETNNQPLKVRIAGSIPSYDDIGSSNKFELVELPLDKKAEFITCCSKTSALAVSHDNVISVFCYGRKMHTASKTTYQDFEHFVDINVPITITEVKMNENIFACRSDKAVHVFKVMFEAEEDDTKNLEMSINLEINNGDHDVFDENFVEWRFESCTSTGTRDKKWETHIKSKLDPRSFPINIHLHEIDKENEKFSPNSVCEFRGPILTIQGCTVDIRLDPKIFELFPRIPSNMYAVTILFKQFDIKKEENKLSALQLVPFYETDVQSDAFIDPLNAASQDTQECLFFSPFTNVGKESEMKAIGVFFSSAREGYLYDITNDVKFLESYAYTSSMKGVFMASSLLHALTETGLETYTIHLGNSVLGKIEFMDSIHNIAPGYEDAVCLLGLRPFLGVDFLVSTEGHIVLVSSVEDSVSNIEPNYENRCTLYSLKDPSPTQVYKDLVEIADNQKPSSPNAYYHLLSEAHMILRVQMKFGKCFDSGVSTLFKTSCLLLADYFLCFDPGNNMNCIPYYHLSCLPPENIIKRILEFRHQAKYGHVLKPLVHYLNSILFSSSQISQTLEFPQGICDTILAAYSEEAPEMVWKVILCSNLKGYKPDKVILMLKHRLTNKQQPFSPISNAADTIALVYLLFQKGNPDVAQNMILSLLKSDLVTILKNIHSKMWEEKNLTSFGKFIKKCRPDAFVEILINCIEKNTFLFSDALRILQSDFPDTELHRVPLSKEFLESYFSEKCSSDNLDHSTSVLLTKVYLKRLLEPQDILMSMNTNPFSGTVSSFVNMFHFRPSWLNELPPFYGKGIARNCLNSKNEKKSQEKNDDKDSNLCSCWTCNEDLLKLQSFLAYLGPTEDIKHLVHDFLCSTEKNSPNWLSLEVICSDEVQALKRLWGQAPKAVLPYARETFKDNNDKWCLLFTALSDYMKIIPDDHPDTETYFQTYHVVLAHLAETLEPVDFLKLLPQEENSNFLPHVKRCIEKHQAEQLRNKIMSLGQEIKSMMLS